MKVDRKKWLVNLSNTKIPQEIEQMLALGHNFNMTESTKSFEIPPFITEFQNNIWLVPKNKRDYLRGTFINILVNHLNKLNNTKANHNISLLKKFIRGNDNLIITRADKGQVTVVLNKSEYISAAEEMLTDDNTYTKTNKNHTDRIQKINNKILKDWYDKKYITDTLKQQLAVHNSTSPRLYILPKIHKATLSYRPIVSSIGGPLHNLGRFVHDMLSNLTSKHSSHVKNSFEFKKNIENIEIPPGYVVLSLDVKSQFTNVPLDLVKRAINEKKARLPNLIPPSEIIKCVEIIMNST